MSNTPDHSNTYVWALRQLIGLGFVLYVIFHFFGATWFSTALSLAILYIWAVQDDKKYQKELDERYGVIDRPH